MLWKTNNIFPYQYTSLLPSFELSRDNSNLRKVLFFAHLPFSSPSHAQNHWRLLSFKSLLRPRLGLVYGPPAVPRRNGLNLLMGRAAKPLLLERASIAGKWIRPVLVHSLFYMASRISKIQGKPLSLQRSDPIYCRRNKFLSQNSYHLMPNG